MIEFISQPWHWSISGAMIALVMFLLIMLDQRFGVSSNFRHMCAMAGAGKQFEYFNYNWKDKIWGLVFLTGAAIGGFIACNYLTSPEPVQISNATQQYLSSVGISTPQTINEGLGFVPSEIFSGSLFSLPKLFILVIGGFFIGFGTRWAGGCTSGHAISGLSELQIPSLIAVVGFFIGGLLMTWLILPHLLKLL